MTDPTWAEVEPCNVIVLFLVGSCQKYISASQGAKGWSSRACGGMLFKIVEALDNSLCEQWRGLYVGKRLLKEGELGYSMMYRIGCSARENVFKSFLLGAAYRT